MVTMEKGRSVSTNLDPVEICIVHDNSSKFCHWISYSGARSRVVLAAGFEEDEVQSFFFIIIWYFIYMIYYNLSLIDWKIGD